MKLFLLFCITVATTSFANGASVDINLVRKIASLGSSDAIIQLPSIIPQIKASKALQSLPKGDSKVHALVSSLQGLTSAAQAGYVAKLTSLGLEFEQYWASNIILIKKLDQGSLNVLENFSLNDNVIIREQIHVSIVGDVAVVDHDIEGRQQVPAQWNVEKIGAPQVWNQTRGEGVIVGSIDTGVNMEHEAFANNFAGAWYDPVYNSSTPTDSMGHGSHTLGIAVGQTNGIGIAPGAQWVSCRGLNNQGSGSEALLTSCAQFMLSATPRPHVITNSWGSVGGSTWFNQQLSAWKEAGIISVFAAGGGGGAGCSTVGSPADQADTIAVGATTSGDTVASSSPRGPGAGGILKPEFVAPGQQIVSAYSGGSNNYMTMSGTSMSSHHMAGSIALYLSVNPGTDLDGIITAFGAGTVRPPITDQDRNCGLPNPGEDYPNQSYGFGRIDVGAVMIN